MFVVTDGDGGAAGEDLDVDRVGGLVFGEASRGGEVEENKALIGIIVDRCWFGIRGGLGRQMGD